MARVKHHHAAAVLWISVGFVMVVVASALFANGLQPHLRATSSYQIAATRSPSPSQLRELCFAGCDEKQNDCLVDSYDDQDICDELIFNDGNGNCYGPDGAFFTCANALENPCAIEQQEAEQTCANEGDECYEKCES